MLHKIENYNALQISRLWDTYAINFPFLCTYMRTRHKNPIVDIKISDELIASLYNEPV